MSQETLSKSSEPSKPTESESYLEIYRDQEIRFIGVIGEKDDLGNVVKRIITLRTKDGEIISEHRGNPIENEMDLDDELIHIIDRIWLNVPWEVY